MLPALPDLLWLRTRPTASSGVAPEAPRQTSDRVTQSVNDGPCGDDRTRSRGRHGCACATGTHARARGGGCWAGRFACPWPRQSLLVESGLRATARRLSWHTFTRSAVVKLVRLALLAGAVPGGPGRSRIATYGRLFEGTDEFSLGQTCSSGLRRRRSMVRSCPSRLIRIITDVTGVTFVRTS